MPHRRVWIFGGCPRNILPDIHVRVEQKGKTKWDKVHSMFLMACQNKELADNFIMFNDDFYVMRPTTYIPTLYRCSLEGHIRRIEEAFHNRQSRYTLLLRKSLDDLNKSGLPTLSYELHTPFVFNKPQLLNMLRTHPDWHCTRTMYGNLYNIGGMESDDVKIFSSNTDLDYKNLRFLSTADSVININNDIWRYIRNQFVRKCRYEY